jgi:general secretion pathway protein A
VDEAHGLSTQVLEEVRLLCNFESDTAKQLQIVLTGQPELREVLNNPELRQLKQRVALRCEIKALPTVEETSLYIKSRLQVAGAYREIFSPGAVDYIFRCTSGIPRAINNVCDNAMLNGFAAGDQMISRATIQEVAETFDILPRMAKFEEIESPARIFPAASRAELWSKGNGNGNGYSRRPEPESEEFVRILPATDEDIIFKEQAQSNSPGRLDDISAAFRYSDNGRGNNGQSL